MKQTQKRKISHTVFERQSLRQTHLRIADSLHKTILQLSHLFQVP